MASFDSSDLPKERLRFGGLMGGSGRPEYKDSDPPTCFTNHCHVAQSWPLNHERDDVNNKSFVFNKDRCGQNVANSIRAVTEPMLASHFGNAVIDPLFARFATLVAEHLAVEKTKYISIVISMTNK
ncbi:hypothetical protein WN943_006226 [Citrus x changshan-huyou]